MTVNMGAATIELYLQQLVRRLPGSLFITVNGTANGDVIKGLTVNGPTSSTAATAAIDCDPRQHADRHDQRR